MKIEWKDPKKELPEPDRIIWFIDQHWKRNGTQSIIIFSGKTLRASKNTMFVENYDDVGLGGLTYELTGTSTHYEQAVAWAYAEDSQLPKFLK